jgi:murein DD-endopeptidase MepM/ murein hydrolase activator NlpD
MAVKPVTPENFSELFLNNEFSAIYAQTADEFKKMVTREDFQNLGKTFNEEVEAYELEMRNGFPGGLTQYIWVDQNRKKGIGVAFDENNAIHRIYMRPYLTFPNSDKKYTKNKYQSPVNGEWFVFWGGTNEFINYHYPDENQRYAYDFVLVRNGQSYKGSGERNEDYYAYGKEVVAPAPGKVVKVMDGITDNIPGEMDESRPTGNIVIIQHSVKEYSMLAHLKERSVVVNEGEAVKAGQPIGKCGNSGNSSEPHLHFQVMDAPNPANATSVRIRWAGEKEPIQGEIVDSSKQKVNWEKRTEQLDDGFFWLDVLLFVPRLIIQFFRWLVSLF